MESPSVVEVVAVDLAIRFGWYAVTVIATGTVAVIGVLMFGRGYRSKIASLEKEIAELKKRPAMIQNVNVGAVPSAQSTATPPSTLRMELVKPSAPTWSKPLARLYWIWRQKIRRPIRQWRIRRRRES